MLEIECDCGATNKVKVNYSSFGPANQEKESVHCAKCGKFLRKIKCLSVDVSLVDPQAD